MSTMTLLGTLRTEVAHHYSEDDRTERPSAIMYRPADTPLRNDGIFRYWMSRDGAYRLTWDGAGWHVTCATWRDGHVYRLADADGQFVGALPLIEGNFALNRGRAYEIRETEPGGAWAVYSA